MHVEPKIAVSYKEKRDKRNEKKSASVESKQEPEIPTNLPKQVQVMKLKKGKIKIQKYIKRKKKFVAYCNMKQQKSRNNRKLIDFTH